MSWKLTSKSRPLRDGRTLVMAVFLGQGMNLTASGPSQPAILAVVMPSLSSARTHSLVTSQSQ